PSILGRILLRGLYAATAKVFADTSSSVFFLLVLRSPRSTPNLDWPHDLPVRYFAALLAIRAPMDPAPTPPSMFTTAIPREQDCSIAARAAMPLSPNP